jgi:hypothetical protein
MTNIVMYSVERQILRNTPEISESRTVNFPKSPKGAILGAMEKADASGGGKGIRRYGFL